MKVGGTMKKVRIRAVLLVMGLLLGCLGACGTSQMSSREDSEEWAQLLPDSDEESQLEKPRPSTDVVKPTLERPVIEDPGKRVTDQYKEEFLGTWDGQTTGYIYEFQSGERLLLTEKGETQTLQYWVQEVGGQVRLHIYDKETEEDTAYSFTMKSGSITLYDGSGSAADVLARRETEKPSPSPVHSAQPTAAASVKPSTVPVPSSVPAPSPVPSPVPSPSPSAVPSPSPSPSSMPIPEELRPVMGKIQCVLDVILDGGSFEDSFWEIVARYASLCKFPKDGDYAVLTPEELEECAAAVYGDLEEIPDCPEDSKVAIHKAADEAAGTAEQYRLQLGNLSDLDMTLENYADGVAYIRVNQGGGKLFSVTVRDETIVSVEEQ